MPVALYWIKRVNVNLHSIVSHAREESMWSSTGPAIGADTFVVTAIASRVAGPALTISARSSSCAKQK